MNWNRILLNGDEQELTLSFGARIFGTGASETITIAGGVNAMFNPGNGDHVKLARSLEDYTSISASGNRLILEDAYGYSITLLVGGTSTLEFANGAVDLSLGFTPDGPQMYLGGAVIPDGESLENYEDVGLDDEFNPVITMDELANYSADNPFDATQGSFIFEFDASEEGVFYIDGFEADDTLHFFNTPTGNPGDFWAAVDEFDTGEALVGAGGIDIQLTGLPNDHFNNAETFMNIYGEDSLAFS